ncbi:Mitochondrial import inner membrane translocase subunit tim23 [Nowakowskiella sp. JEL0407]|nr:Mitochondrial import inner membrane translocase subunit tim23 [Nowakowskiella sp. JEL0407]
MFGFFNRNKKDQEEKDSSSQKPQPKTLAELEPETVSSMLGGVKLTNEKFLGLDNGVEYLTIEENPFMPEIKLAGSFGPFPMRNDSDKCLYGTGMGYLLGISTGGLYGIIRGLRSSQGKLFRLRLNSVLNSTTRYGPRAANGMGVLTLSWALLDSGLSRLRDGKSDYYNHISAAFLSGFLYRSTAGIRPALFAGWIMASVVSAYGIVVHVQENGLPFLKFEKREDGSQAAQ